MLIDTHCHLDFPDFDPDRDLVVARAKEAGVEYIVNIGSSLQGSAQSVQLSQRFPCVWATVGCHPHEADRTTGQTLSALRSLAQDNKVVAIGEVGLDYYKNYSKKENQVPLFEKLVALAKEADLPLVIHCRLAETDTLRILRGAMPVKAVVHCFSGDAEFLRECLGLGFFVSFTCNITYKKAQALRDLVNMVPPDRLLLETDAPFLPPEGLRGKRNEPFQVKLLAEVIAGIKQVSMQEVARFTTVNAKNFFKLP